MRILGTLGVCLWTLAVTASSEHSRSVQLAFVCHPFPVTLNRNYPSRHNNKEREGSVVPRKVSAILSNSRLFSSVQTSNSAQTSPIETAVPSGCNRVAVFAKKCVQYCVSLILRQAMYLAVLSSIDIGIAAYRHFTSRLRIDSKTVVDASTSSASHLSNPGKVAIVPSYSMISVRAQGLLIATGTLCACWLYSLLRFTIEKNMETRRIRRAIINYEKEKENFIRDGADNEADAALGRTRLRSRTDSQDDSDNHW